MSVNRSEGTSPSTRRCSPISLVCHSNHVNVVFVYRPANLGSTTSTTSNYDDNPTNPGRLTSTPVDTAAPTRTTPRGPSNRQPVKTVESHVISVQAFTGVSGCGFYASPAGATLTLWGFSPGAPPPSLFPAGPRLCLPFSLVGRVNKHITRRGEEARDPPLPWRMQ